MKTNLLVALGIAFVAGLASFLPPTIPLDVMGRAEAATPRTKAIEHVSPEQFNNLIIKPAGTCSWDFTAMSSSGETSLTPRRESATCLAVGCRITDSCHVSTDFGLDGGAAASTSVIFSCRAVTDGVVFAAAALQTDGGSVDLADAGYTGRCSR